MESPTEKQLKYAKRLGINVPLNITRSELSGLIAKKESANPDLAKQREAIKEKVHIREYGKEFVQLEKEWEELLERTSQILAVYKRGSDIIVDVLSIDALDINNRDQLFIVATEPKRIENGGMPYLDEGKNFKLLVKDVLYYEPADVGADVDAYNSIIEKGLKKAQSLRPDLKCDSPVNAQKAAQTITGCGCMGVLFIIGIIFLLGVLRGCK